MFCKYNYESLTQSMGTLWKAVKWVSLGDPSCSYTIIDIWWRKKNNYVVFERRSYSMFAWYMHGPCFGVIAVWLSESRFTCLWDLTWVPEVGCVLFIWSKICHGHKLITNNINYCRYKVRTYISPQSTASSTTRYSKTPYTAICSSYHLPVLAGHLAFVGMS